MDFDVLTVYAPSAAATAPNTLSESLAQPPPRGFRFPRGQRNGALNEFGKMQFFLLRSSIFQLQKILTSINPNRA